MSWACECFVKKIEMTTVKETFLGCTAVLVSNTCLLANSYIAKHQAVAPGQILTTRSVPQIVLFGLWALYQRQRNFLPQRNLIIYLADVFSPRLCGTRPWRLPLWHTFIRFWISRSFLVALNAYISQSGMSFFVPNCFVDVKSKAAYISPIFEIWGNHVWHVIKKNW